MGLSEALVHECVRRLYRSRMRILCTHPFYGLLLMHMVYSIDEGCDTAYTDGTRIAFCPQFLDRLADSELDFIMMHEIMHVVLQHCLRGNDLDQERFNIACDIVVNSNILLECGDIESITVANQGGPSMHVAPDGEEGHLYTAEQVYEMLPPTPEDASQPKAACSGSGGGGIREHANGTGDVPQRWDNHSHWGEFATDDTLRDVWVQWVTDCCEVIEMREEMNGYGLLPGFARRLLKELRKPQIDWRTILDEFVQEEVVDYSFAPPDHRFVDSPFFLPDFNGTEVMPEDILFMIDTSASMSDDQVTAAYSEVRGAIDQFGGKLRGLLGFFDAAIAEPRPFEDEDSLGIITPVGGGGTDFQIIFNYVRSHMQDRPPASIIVLTDGEAPFPPERMAGGVPVLWLLNNDRVDPPWGNVARIDVQ